MNFKRSVSLTAGVALAASMFANATQLAPGAAEVSRKSDASKKTEASSPDELTNFVPGRIAGLSPNLSGSPVSPVAPKSASHVDDDKRNQPNTVLTPTGLATTETVFSYCAQVDRSASPNYLAGVAMITRGHHENEVAGLRRTSDYLKTQATINTQLAKVPYGSGLLACRAFRGATRNLGVSSPVRTGLGSF